AWWEPEGAIHRVSRNASSTESATLLAIYIAPKGATAADLIKPILGLQLKELAGAPEEIRTPDPQIRSLQVGAGPAVVARRFGCTHNAVGIAPSKAGRGTPAPTGASRHAAVAPQSVRG